jgi:predicted ferric reductase
MTATNLAWYTARAAGLVSWLLLSASIAWGVLLSTKVLGRKPGAKWLLDLHRFLGGLSVVFVGVHLAALVADTFVDFGPTELLVPLTSTYRPAAVAWGIVAFYVLLAIEITSLLMKRLPRRVWHAVHLGSFVLFVVATIHLFTAGTDANNLLLRGIAGAVIAEVVGFAILKVVTRKPTRPRPRHPEPAAEVVPLSTSSGAGW